MKSENITWETTQPANSETENCVYMIKSNKVKCKQKYTEETKRGFAKRLSEQRGYITRMFPTKANNM